MEYQNTGIIMTIVFSVDERLLWIVAAAAAELGW